MFTALRGTFLLPDSVQGQVGLVASKLLHRSTYYHKTVETGNSMFRTIFVLCYIQ